MKRTMNYRELDEYVWERQHGCYDEPELDEYYGVTDPMDVSGDVCWDEVVDKMVEEEYDEPCDFENGIMGSDIKKSHECDEFKPLPGGYEEIGDIFHVVGIGRISGFGTGEDIALAVQSLMVKDRQYHYEFEFFENK